MSVVFMDLDLFNSILGVFVLLAITCAVLYIQSNRKDPSQIELSATEQISSSSK